jgi:hypothetical protein
LNIGWALLLACAPDPVEQTPCEEVGAPGLDLAPSDLDFGAFDDGDSLLYGTPPQGGAPYSPFKARASGIDGLDETTVVNLHAVDLDDGSELGDISYDVRFVCANVGDAAGSWVGSDLHLRFEGWSLEDLAGRSAEITMTVTAQSGDEIDAALAGLLTLMGE